MISQYMQLCLSSPTCNRTRRSVGCRLSELAWGYLQEELEHVLAGLGVAVLLFGGAQGAVAFVDVVIFDETLR